MQTDKTIILTSTQIEHKIRRIAFQTYESNIEEKTVVIAGIVENGYKIAQKLKSAVESISDIKVILCEVHIDKKNPLNTISTSIPSDEYKEQSIVLVDDVLHSGTTLIYGVRHFLNVPLKRFKTAVLVNRSHKKYPVKADFKGISLSTSFNENVKVIIDDADMQVILE
ncbi:MAG: phosphoribosyltransferase [Bacteroidetes bacterium]|jgi:pyrimidine operon attenuation protein/uracil phosphoribosyltransferase|nr:phosphoribosyltransferase [Bacteroidota bacterium]